MAFSLFKKTNKDYVALDIGNQNTKVAVLSPKGEILNVVTQPTPPNTFDSGIIVNQQELTDFILSLIGILDLSGEISVITGVSGKGVITKKIDIPQMEENLIPEHLPFEAEQYLPYEVDEMDLDYEILKNIPTNVEGEIPLLLVAVLKKTVEQYNDFFEKSYLSFDVLDANVFALYNIFEKNYDLDPDENYLLLDVGLNNTNLVAIVKNQIVFTRSLPLGGGFYTEELKKSLNLSYSEAEDLKKSLSQEGQHPADVAMAVQNNLNPLFCDEVFSGYEFYLSFFPDNKISQIYVTGGGSRTLGLLDSLSSKFQVPAQALNPFQNMNVPPHLNGQEEEFFAFSSVVLGLALRGL